MKEKEEQMMNRPYVICHMLGSLDGKINGPFMAEESTRQLSSQYGKIRKEMQADAWLFGATTTKEFLGYRKPVLKNDTSVPGGDFIADDHAELYYISVDVEGGIGWESGYFDKSGSTSHVIEILTGTTPDSFKAYLRERGVSYIIAGSDALDCRLAMEKLYQLFDIKKVAICGGGQVNWSFLQAGVVDELSLLLAPVTDGSSGSASVFSRFSSDSDTISVEFSLEQVQKIGDNGLHLIYKVKNAK
jgi:riboflavin biosynthesis pyrimidine reductase